MHRGRHTWEQYVRCYLSKAVYSTFFTSTGIEGGKAATYQAKLAISVRGNLLVVLRPTKVS